MSGLVLSLFPGIGLLDMAFEAEGFCVVRGPDVLWGGDIKRFHPPAGKFDGLIGGPPCQKFTGLANFAHRWKHRPEDLIPEFARVVAEAAPSWFLMENVLAAPIPQVPCYLVRDVAVNSRQFGSPQSRERRFSFGTEDGRRLDADIAAEVFSAHVSPEFTRAVTSAKQGTRERMRGAIEALTVEEALRRQGLPPDFFGDRSPFVRKAQLKMVAEGVPMPMGRAVARAVKRALADTDTRRAS